jgi:pSer/pThr/pTyr-binding forkhead associated (FHA) protein
MGRDSDGRPGFGERAQGALAQFCVDRRGVWMQLGAGSRGVYVNGRPVRRMAMLRVGDGVFIEGTELLLVGDDPLPAPVATPKPAPLAESDPRLVLRGVGGSHHGRCVTLGQPRLVGRLAECDIRVDEPAFADRHARLEPHPDGAVLRDLGSVDGSVVNGQRVRHALLRAGDQVVFDAHHRFVVEAPSVSSWHAASVGEARAAADEREHEQLPVTASVGASARRMPWLLLAALLLSGALSLLLLYGVR